MKGGLVWFELPGISKNRGYENWESTQRSYQNETRARNVFELHSSILKRCLRCVTHLCDEMPSPTVECSTL